MKANVVITTLHTCRMMAITSSPSPRRRRLALFHTTRLAPSAYTEGLLERLFFALLRLLGLAAGAVPVVYHLHGQHKIERESDQVSVED